MNTRKWESFSVEATQNVATVDIDTGSKGTLYGPTFFRELPLLLDELAAEPDVRAIVIRSTGEQFTFGIDLGAMGEMFGAAFSEGGQAQERLAFRCRIRTVQSAVGSLASCPTPVVAAIHGRCIGVGLDLVTAADLRYASTDALISAREVKVGIVADLGTLQRLPLLIGQSNTRELALTGDDVTARRAHEMGLVNGVLDDRWALYAHAQAVAERIAANPPLAVQGVKHVLNEAVQQHISNGLDYVATWNAAALPSRESQDAVASILTHRR